MQSTHRFTIAGAILLVGVVLGAFAGFPAEALRWERFATAYEDMVVVTEAEYRDDDNELRVRAESSSATSTLSVYDLAGNLIGVLTRVDSTRHEGRFDMAANPRVITVRSSEGGEATVLVTGDNPPTVTPSPGPLVSATATGTATATETETVSTPAATSTETGTPTEPPVGFTPTATTTAGSSTATHSTVKILLPIVLDNAALGGGR